jgi:cysteine-rich repeat protein
MDDLPNLLADTARCGDSRVDAPETCDDGNDVDEDACTNTCRRAACGDGILRSDLRYGHENFEICDDGNTVDEDACLNNCTEAFCGDGFLRRDLDPEEDVDGERCDDGNDDNQDTCSRDCNPDDHGNEFETATRIFEHQPLLGRLEQGAFEDSGDTFVYTALVDGLHAFYTNAGPAPSADPACNVYNEQYRKLASNDDGFGAGSEQCLVELAMRAGQTVYLEIDSLVAYGNYYANVEGPCNNGIIEEHEECDPDASGEWDDFSCRQDCRIRRTFALGVDSSCSLDDGTAHCWGSWLHRVPGFLPVGERDNGVEYARFDDGREIPCAMRPEPITSNLPITHITRAGRGVCGHDRQGQHLCWGGDVGERGYAPDTLLTAGSCGEVNTRDKCFDSATHIASISDHGVGMAVNQTSQCTVGRLGGVMCWGAWTPSSYLGELGNAAEDIVVEPFRALRNPQPVTGLDPDDPIIFLDGQAYTMCGVTRLGNVWCWGSNRYGQLGLGSGEGPETCPGGPCSTQARKVTLPGFAIDVDVGAHAVCAILRDGPLYCWGKASVTGTFEPGSCADGDCVPAPQLLNDGISELSAVVVRVAVGDDHTCAVGDDGVAACWGLMRHGRLGHGGAPPEEFSDLTEDEPRVISRLINVTDIAVGDRHSCARVRSSRGLGDRLYCWGENITGQLGLGLLSPYNDLPQRVLSPR